MAVRMPAPSQAGPFTVAADAVGPAHAPPVDGLPGPGARRHGIGSGTTLATDLISRDGMMSGIDDDGDVIAGHTCPKHTGRLEVGIRFGQRDLSFIRDPFLLFARKGQPSAKDGDFLDGSAARTSWDR